MIWVVERDVAFSISTQISLGVLVSGDGRFREDVDSPLSLAPGRWLDVTALLCSAQVVATRRVGGSMVMCVFPVGMAVVVAVVAVSASMRMAVTTQDKETQKVGEETDASHS
jgi:hypothetical protein